MKLHVTKSKLYALVAAYEPLPPQATTVFNKVNRAQRYFFKWFSASGIGCKACLNYCTSRPILSILCGNEQRTIVLYFRDLQERGMIDGQRPTQLPSERAGLLCSEKTNGSWPPFHE